MNPYGNYSGESSAHSYVISGRTDWAQVSRGNTISKVASSKSKEIIHPIFLSMAYVTSDPEWRKILENAYYNKFPPKFGFTQGNITFRRGARKIFKQHLPEEDIQEAFRIFKGFLCQYQGIHTQQDTIETDIAEKYYAQENTITIWSKASKTSREIMIHKFIEEAVRNLELTHAEKSQLSDEITYGLLYKILNKDNITISGNNITNISVLHWYPEARLFKLDQNLQPKIAIVKPNKQTISRSFKDMFPTYGKRWVTFQKSLPATLTRSQMIDPTAPVHIQGIENLDQYQSYHTDNQSSTA